MMQRSNQNATAAFVLCTHHNAVSSSISRVPVVISGIFTSSESACRRQIGAQQGTKFLTVPVREGTLQPTRLTELCSTTRAMKGTLRMSSSPGTGQDEASMPIKGGNLGASSDEDTSVPNTEVAADADFSDEEPVRGPFGRFKRWYGRMVAKRSALRAGALRNYGIAAFISYGFFDFITYTISFLFSLRAFVASGKTLTWQTLPQVLALMWGINNLSRPFRIAGALALAPVVDRRVVKPVSAFFSRIFSKNRTDSSSPSSSASTQPSDASPSSVPPPPPSSASPP